MTTLLTLAHLHPWPALLLLLLGLGDLLLTAVVWGLAWAWL